MRTVNQVDLDALADARRSEWDRLGELTRSSRLSGAEVDELIDRYRSASADLADIKTTTGQTALGAWLSTQISRARLRLTGTNENVLIVILRFFALQLPAALYRVRWLTLAVGAGTITVAAVAAAWVASDPAVLAALGPKAQLEQYAQNDFTTYYTENPAAQFAGMVWTNNAWIAAQAVLFGITGFWPVMVIMQNAVALGQAAGVMFAFDRGDVFVLYILPHGLLELTCIFVAAAAGLRVFWAVVAPGGRTRLEAVAEAGLSMATIAIGLVFALGLSGLVEGFVTGQPWPWPLKIGIGAAALAVFLVYMVVVGGRAARAGEDGGLTEYDGGTKRLVAS